MAEIVICSAATETGLLTSGIPNSGASVDFSLYEANGVTPVNIVDASAGTPGIPINFDAPEPGTFASGLLASSICFVFFLHDRLTKRRNNSRPVPRSPVPTRTR